MKKENLVYKIEEYLNKNFLIEVRNKTSGITDISTPKVETKKDLTELVFILDRSGSMSGLESDLIDGYNVFLEKQRNEVGNAIITTVLFDDKYELLHDRINVKGAAPITNKDYYVRGTNALLDAVGKTILKIEGAQIRTIKNERPEKTLAIIITNGMDKTSREFTKDKVKEMVERMHKKHGWEFIFLGANIDSIDTAGGIGIRTDRIANYHADSVGIAQNFCTVSAVASELRTNRSISDNWKADIDKDYKGRKNENKNFSSIKLL